MQDLIRSTRQRFSFAWSKFGKKEVERKWYKDSFSYLKYIPAYIFKGKDRIGLDVGCGSGSDLLNIAQWGARVVGIDISDTIKVAHENTAVFNNIYIAQGDIYQLPLKDGIFDFVYSFGVLHHLPHADLAFESLCAKAKKGGVVIVYVYEDFSERSNLEKFLLALVNSLRIITTRMPSFLLYFLSIVISPFVFLFCSLPYQVLKRIKFTKKLSERIPFRHTVRLDCIVSDLYDRFSPPIENRYSRKEVENWFLRLGFEDVNIINHRGWVAWGRKR